MSAPNPATTSMVSVYDGQRCIGHVLGRGCSGFEAFDAQRPLGLYATQKLAADALSDGGAR
jgi:hypothetical protein